MSATTRTWQTRRDLRVDWEFKSGLGDKTRPAGAMAFELLRDASGARFVKLAYYTQTLDQMRNAAPLSRAQPPDRADIAIKFCPNPRQDGARPWADFYESARKNCLIPIASA
jgi:4-phytase/acid phosphatase